MEMDNHNDMELQLGYLCNHLERGQKGLNTEIENLLSLSHGGLILNSESTNRRQIELVCTSCKMLMENQIKLISVLEPLLNNLNSSLKREE